MTDVLIYHNPRCSKSRQALALLQQKGIEPRVINYMHDPLSVTELRALLKKLGMGARDLLRSSETVYRERGLSDMSLGEAALIEAMREEPCLMQRPVVVCGARAIVARPADLALDILP